MYGTSLLGEGWRCQLVAALLASNRAPLMRTGLIAPQSGDPLTSLHASCGDLFAAPHYPHNPCGTARLAVAVRMTCSPNKGGLEVYLIAGSRNPSLRLIAKPIYIDTFGFAYQSAGLTE